MYLTTQLFERFYIAFIYLLYDLFNNAVNFPDCIASNDG